MDLMHVLSSLAWPVAIGLGWVVGEIVYRAWGVPRVAAYGLLGFVLGGTQLGWLGDAHQTDLLWLVHVAFGLTLFEFGFRINLNWLWRNPGFTLQVVVEAALIFLLVWLACGLLGMDPLVSWMVAALAASGSPAGLMRVVNEGRASGIVTERSLHASAVQCVIAVLLFKLAAGAWTLSSLGDWGQALWNSFVMLLGSAALGVLFGVFLPWLIHRLGPPVPDTTLPFAIAVMLLVSVTLAWKLSPVLATLVFGLMARHRRIGLTSAQRNFGALGDVMAVLLFIFAGAALDGAQVLQGWWIGLLIVGLRLGVKLGVAWVGARSDGMGRDKALLAGVASTPISVFVILLLEQARVMGLDVLGVVAPLAAATWLLEIAGPALTRWALKRANELAPPEGR
ncbi:cation:proton antiporter [Ideonella sp. 4Y11]|uniref:Cation:proton antiporter n=1 Tax=Ideonella aquatica TaxID=2824119 RepID=A0A941BJV9_9BURK|nr:cation:proton antiporter [Ideonella aquatica]MBQ0957914.1 cation:proton antiporter [Ideonella aquatica]